MAILDNSDLPFLRILLTLPSLWIRDVLDRSKFAGKKHATIMSDNPGKVVNRYVFSKLFSKAWTNAMSIRNIMSGFKVCGIYPFDRNALRLPLEEVPKRMETLAKKSGLAYIPLFSPAKRRNYHHRSESSDSSRSIHSPSTSRHYKHSHPSSDQHCRLSSLQCDPASQSLSSRCDRDLSSQHR